MLQLPNKLVCAENGDPRRLGSPVEEDIHQVAERSRRLIRGPPASCKKRAHRSRCSLSKLLPAANALGQRRQSRFARWRECAPRARSCERRMGEGRLPGAAPRRSGLALAERRRSPRKEESRRGDDEVAMGAS
mgnify:CR=1 FL=1